MCCVKIFHKVVTNYENLCQIFGILRYSFMGPQLIQRYTADLVYRMLSINYKDQSDAGYFTCYAFILHFKICNRPDSKRLLKFDDNVCVDDNIFWQI